MSEVATRDEYSDISATEKLAMAIAAYGGHPTYYGRPVTWEMLPDESKAIGAREWREKRAKVNPYTGLTEEQVGVITGILGEGLNEQLPGYVAAEVDRILPALVNLRVQEAVTSILKSLDTAISAAETSRVETRALRFELDQAKTNGFVAKGSPHASARACSALWACQS